MAQLTDTQVTGKVSASVAASDPADYTRLGEVLALLTGKSDVGHTHVASDITDLASLLPAYTPGNAGIGIAAGAISSVLSSGGGLTLLADGLAVDPGFVSLVGHTHVLADITDYATATFLVSDTLGWIVGAAGISGVVRLATGGGLLSDSDGLYADVGTGALQLAAGNHTHSLLHPALTLGESNTLALTLNQQTLAGEVALASGGGLIAPGGLALDFGTGHNQAARGDHTHAALGLSLLATSSLALFADSSSTILSGVVLCDPAPGAGRSVISVGGAGLFLQLGTDGNSAAAGNHGHALATSGVSGFMAATDWALLHSFTTPAVSVVPPLRQSGVGNGPTQLYMNPATDTSDGYLQAADKAKLDSLDAGTWTYDLPLTLVSARHLQIAKADSAHDGYLCMADWNAFNAKQPAMTIQSPLTYIGGILSLPPAAPSSSGVGGAPGCLTATDKEKLNNLVLGQPSIATVAALISAPLPLSGVGFSSVTEMTNFTNNLNTLINQFNTLLYELKSAGVIALP